MKGLDKIRKEIDKIILREIEKGTSIDIIDKFEKIDDMIYELQKQEKYNTKIEQVKNSQKI